ncbi:hypothetical protein BS78_04G011000 [Paspalum vaginatum]|nr:hypothetical protein BS78_04G011000 [Paspalum vaginatum]
MAAAAPPPLMDELIEQFLLRLPPDDPTSLVHAALVCKKWARLVSARGFRRRIRKHHRAKLLRMARIPPSAGRICHGDFCAIRGIAAIYAC